MGVIVSKSGDAFNRVVVKIDNRRLEAFQKQLKRSIIVKVGILGAKTTRTPIVIDKKSKTNPEKTPLNNAEIGLIHEKGVKSKNIPRRSFLEVPLTNGMADAQKEIGKALDQALKKDDVKLFFAKMGVLAEGIVLMSFGNKGYFGEWPDLKRREGTPLINTGQLRKSIMHEVKEG